MYVLERLKALSDGENEATILHWTLWEIHYPPTAPKCSDANIRIYTVNSIQTGKCLGAKFSAEDCLSAE